VCSCHCSDVPEELNRGDDAWTVPTGAAEVTDVERDDELTVPGDGDFENHVIAWIRVQTVSPSGTDEGAVGSRRGGAEEVRG